MTRENRQDNSSAGITLPRTWIGSATLTMIYLSARTIY